MGLIELKGTAFWHIRTYSPWNVNQRFGGTYLFHLRGRRISGARYPRGSRWQAVLFVDLKSHTDRTDSEQAAVMGLYEGSYEVSGSRKCMELLHQFGDDSLSEGFCSMLLLSWKWRRIKGDVSCHLSMAYQSSLYWLRLVKTSKSFGHTGEYYGALRY